MRAILKSPLYLLLIAVFFCVHGSAENFGSLTVKEVVLTGLSIIFFIAVLFGIFWIGMRRIQPAALLTVFISTWYFFFGALHDFLKVYPVFNIVQKYIVLLPLLLLATLLWFVFLKRKPALHHRLTLFLNCLLIIYCAVDVLRITVKAFSTGKKNSAISFNYKTVTEKPDVFLLLFDGYPGQKSLTDSFGFSNEDMLKFLAADSFYVVPGSSNYSLTQFSLASLFNMNYISPDFDPAAVTQKDLQNRQNEIGRGEVFTIFENMGYTLRNNSVFDVKDMPGITDANSFILGHSFLLTDKILLNRLNRDIGASLPPGLVKWVPFLREQSPDRQRKDNELTVTKLMEIAAEPQGAAPVFCYSHFLMPHTPFYYDSSGNRVPEKVYMYSDEYTIKKNFISYLKYTNGIVKKLLGELKKQRPGA
ncbi:MAG: hypothetical protein WKF88_10885, partial [Ferruginibacter sp.]